MAQGRAPPEEFSREMGCTVADFTRWLPGATRNAPVESIALAGGGERHRVTVGDGTVEFLLREMPLRRIAGIALPVLSVTVRFSGLDEAARSAFLSYFDHYTRRGGG